MKATIYAVPKFAITFTKAELDVLTMCSKLHYDGVCRSAGNVGGFLFGWNNCLTSPDEKYPNDPQTAAVSTTHRELDTCLKILEMPASQYAKDASTLSLQLSGLLSAGQYFTKDLQTHYN